MTFTVKLADGTEHTFDGAQTTHSYSIEANGVLVIISRTDGTNQTDRYSPAEDIRHRNQRRRTSRYDRQPGAGEFPSHPFPHHH